MHLFRLECRRSAYSKKVLLAKSDPFQVCCSLQALRTDPCQEDFDRVQVLIVFVVKKAMQVEL